MPPMQGAGAGDGDGAVGVQCASAGRFGACRASRPVRMAFSYGLGVKAGALRRLLSALSESSMIENARQQKITNAVSRIAPWWVVLYVFCLPGAGSSEIALALGVLLTLLGWVAGGRAVMALPGRAVWQAIGVVFLAYWGSELVSAIWAQVPAKAWREVARDVRYLPALWLAALAMREAAGRKVVYAGIAAIVAFWTVDAALQALTGISPTLAVCKWFAPQMEPRQLDMTRLQGLFGSHNYTLGQTLASLSPFLLFWVRGRVAWLAAVVLLEFVILLTGTRAAWITLGVVVLCELWLNREVLRCFGRKAQVAFVLGVCLLTLAVAGVAWQKPGFQQRAKTAAMLTPFVSQSGSMGVPQQATTAPKPPVVSTKSDSESLQQQAKAAAKRRDIERDHAKDVATSFRWTIWTTSVPRMIAEHWGVGVGVRGFRDVYPRYAGKERAGEGDFFTQHGGTVLHAHQVVLEVWSETGVVGLLMWLAAAFWLIRRWRDAAEAARVRASPATVAVMVTFFPLNTHLAVFSSHWGGFSLMLTGLFVGALCSREPLLPIKRSLRECRKILVIKHGAFGDLVQSFGTLADIRADLPQAQITLLTAPAYRKLMERCPYVDRVLTDARAKWWQWRVNRRLLRTLAVQAFDGVIDLQHSGRVRYYRYALFRDAVWVGKSSAPAPSMLESFRLQLLAAGIAVKHSPQPDAQWMAAEMGDFLRQRGVPERFVFLVPGCSAGHPEKRWPHYATLAQALCERGIAVVSAPGPDELSWARTLGGHVLLHDNGGVLDWFELAGVLRRAAFVVGNDTGPSHLAAALGRRGLALFGPASSAARTALGRAQFAVLEVEDLNKLSVETVLQRVCEALEQA